MSSTGAGPGTPLRPGTPRILLFTGKGGVGKTTASAATALACADAGRRTIVLSTDPAHSLADAYDVALGPTPTTVAPGLWGQQLDAHLRMEEAWADIQAYVVAVLGWAGIDAIEAEELAVIPGLDEVFGLSDIKAFAASGEWDVIVVDCAPTAETIRFLSLPDVLSWYMERIFPVERRVVRAVRPLLSRVTTMPVAGEDVFDAARRFYDRLDGVRELLTDGSHTSVRLVVNPERMVVAEARRTYTYLSLFGYRTDAVIANRLLPDAVTDPWFAAWKATHAEHMATIVDGFAPLPVLRAELAATEVVGLERLRQFGGALYAGLDPSAVLHEGDPLRIERRGSRYLLSLELPFAEAADLEVGRRHDELFVRVGSYRRAIVLPDSLRHRPVDAARMADNRLEVTFGTRPAAGADAGASKV
ncbi:MAG TPA: ArsA family ATPase [Acidimicrobiales bacterium]|jgi:arsenite-transporting ATPase|nr:ArsA family ATPase [Acidimicrobiales bacterium]